MNLHNWFWYDIVESNTSVNTCSKTLDDSLERNDASIWNECSLQHLHVFSNGSGCHWSRTCARLCRNCTLLRMQCPFHIFLNENHIVDVSMYNMSFKIVHHFSKYIIWYSSKTTEHTLGITPFDVGSSPLKSTIIWRMCILQPESNEALFEHMLYCLHAALFWKGIVVLEAYVISFCAISPWYEWDMWSKKYYCWLVLKTFL